MQLGRLASKSNQYPKAASHFRRAIAVDSTHAEAYGSLGIVYLRMDRLGQARRMFKKVLELDPGNRAARRILKRLSPRSSGDSAVSLPAPNGPRCP